MFFDGNEFDIDLSFLKTNNIFENYNQYDVKKSNKFLPYFFVDEGFLKGNMFIKEYKPYKNYEIKNIATSDERQSLLNKIMAYNFAFNDFNLYLDIYPEDQQALEMFKKYVEEYKKLKKEYASIYGPLTLTQSKYQNYEWIKNPWPWQPTGGDMFV